mmetsp:Transcript_35939/g.86762  ORF Transcript_35939/g.86762 Transcript_35939/m.86762 type:complete len:121 (+) Transcript_35939:1247-1609(+)
MPRPATMGTRTGTTGAAEAGAVVEAIDTRAVAAGVVGTISGADAAAGVAEGEAAVVEAAGAIDVMIAVSVPPAGVAEAEVTVVTVAAVMVVEVAAETGVTGGDDVTMSSKEELVVAPHNY